MKRSTLKKASPDSVIRLAKWLKLDIEGMSPHQILKLVVWRLHRNRQLGYGYVS